jgi:hypothetical protein
MTRAAVMEMAPVALRLVAAVFWAGIRQRLPFRGRGLKAGIYRQDLPGGKQAEVQLILVEDKDSPVVLID